LLTLQQTRSRLVILLQFLPRPSNKLTLVSWRWHVMEAAVVVVDTAEVDSVVAVVVAAVEVRFAVIPSFHPLMGLTKVVVIRRFHLF
jgi:hypothetical protein